MKSLLIWSAVALASTHVAAAQSDHSAKETRALMHAYAKCVVVRQPRKSSAAILSNLGNRILRKRYPEIFIGECLAQQVETTTSMSFEGDLYRFALADALVNREFAAGDPPNLAGLPPLSHRDPGPEPTRTKADGKVMKQQEYDAALEEYNKDASFAWLSRYGECVVRLSPLEGRSLILSDPDSPKETAAFNNLRPALEYCLPEGETLKFGRVALRGTVAINYYRLAHAARAARAKAAS